MDLNNKEPYIIKLIKGKKSLSVTFWIWFVFVSLLINIFVNNSFNSVNYHSNKDDIFLSFVIYILILIYSILIFIAIHKSCINYLGNKLWSFLAKVIISINLFFSLFQAYELIKIYIFEDYVIRSEINNFKKNLPMKVDSNSYLINLEAKDKTISYTYLLENIDTNSKENLNKFKSQVQNSLCEDDNTLKLLKKDYILDYTYVDENEVNLTNIMTKKEDCGKNIYDLDILKQILKNEN